MVERRSKCRAIGPYLPWRRRLVDAHFREQWREAVRLANSIPEPQATDENTPLLWNDRLGRAIAGARGVQEVDRG